MADREGFQFEFKYNIDVEKNTMNQACKVLDDFYKKYENKKIKVDTSDMVKAARNGISQIQALYQKGFGEEIPWWDIEDGLKEELDRASQRMREFFAKTKLTFSDGLTIDALDLGLSDALNRNVTLSVVDLTGRISELGDKISSVVSQLKEFGGATGKIGQLDLEPGMSLSTDELRKKIELVRLLVNYQEEMEDLTGKSFSSKQSPIRMATNDANDLIDSMEQDLQAMRDYNIQTTALLEEREKILGSASQYWDGDYQDWATDAFKSGNLDDFKQYINDLKACIRSQEDAIENMQGWRTELFSQDYAGRMVDAQDELNRLRDCLKELENLKVDKPIVTDEPTSNNLSGVIAQLEEIKQAIVGITTAFKPLTDALSSEDSAISAMVKTNIADLELLNTKVRETFKNIEILSQKDFSVNTFISEGTGIDAEAKQLRDYQNVARELSKQVKSLYKEAGETYKTGGTALNRDYMKLLQNLATGELGSKGTRMRIEGFSFNAIIKEIGKAGSLGEVDSIIDRLNHLKTLLLEFNNLRNDILPGSFTKSYKDIQKWDDTTKESVSNIRQVAEESKEVTANLGEQNVDVLVGQIKTSSEQIKVELNTIRQLIDQTFDFSTINPNIENIKSITEQIYQQFVNLQSKINAIEFKVNLPQVASGNKVEADIIDKTSDAMKDEGDAAKNAVPKKNAFNEANQRVAEGMRETGNAGKVAADGIKAETQAIREYDKVATTVDLEGVPLSQNRTQSGIHQDAVTTVKENYTWNADDNAWDLTTKQFIRDYKAYEKLEADAQKRIQKAQATLKNFMSQFDNKTAGQWGNTGLYKELKDISSNGIGNVDEIDKVLNKMQLLDAEYNNVVKSFRKGTKSMNPFVNAFNSMDEMSEKVRQVQLSFGELKFPENTLREQIEGLPALLERLQEALKPDEKGIVNIAKVAEAYGDLNAAIKAANTSISTQRKVDSSQTKQLEDLDKLYKKQAESAAKITKYRSELQAGNAGKEESRRLFEKIQQEQENIKNIQTEINSYGELYKRSIQLEAINKQRKKTLEAIADIQAKSVDKTTTESQKYGKTIYNRESRYKDTIDANLRSVGEQGIHIDDDFLKKIERYKQAYQEFERLRNQIANSTNVSDGLKSQFQDSALEVETLRKEIMSLFKEVQKFPNIPKGAALLGSTNIDPNKIKDAKLALIEYANEVTNSQIKITGFNAAGTELYGTLNKGSGMVENITVSLKEASNQIVAFANSSKQVKSVWDQISGALTQGIQRLAVMYLSFYDIIRYVRKGVSYVKEIDLALTELKKVTDETESSYNRFLKTASNVSSKIGSTVSDFTDATAAFARLGYSMDEATSMAETAIIYKNVADGLDSVEESSESIISTMAAFGIQANDTLSIVDKFNAVGNNFAITSAGIGDALQRSASALYTAGNTIDESVALVTAANSVIQNPEQVGNALKTLSLRLRGAKTELEEAGLETDNMAESTSTLQAKLKALTHGKVDIMLDPDTFKSTTQILREMAGAWEDMTDIERAAALELMGGKRQANILSSVITNFETVEDVIKTSMNSAGSAYAENEKWLNSIEGKTYQFTNALETMWSNMVDSNMVKSFIDFGTSIVKLLDSIPGKILAIVGATAGLAKLKGFSIKGLGLEALNSLKNIASVQATLTSLQKMAPVGANMQTEAISAYAMAVSNLTAKQQAGALATAGLNKEQIQLALTLNGLSDSVVREATAHTMATSAKKQSEVADTALIKTKLLHNAATLEAIGSEDALATAQFLRQHATKVANVEELQSLAVFKALTPERQAAVLLSYQQAAANVTEAGTWKALGIAMKMAWQNNPVGLIITGITTLISVISLGSLVFGDLFKSAKESADAAQDAINTYNETKKSIDEQKKTVDELGESYAKLSAGVNTSTNANIGLTTEAYEEYLSVCNEIAEIYPELVTGYDAQGNAILSLKGKVDQLNDSYEEAKKNAANELLTSKNKKDVWKTYENKIANEKYTAFNSDHEYAEINKLDLQKMLEALSKMPHQQINDLYNFDKDGNAAMWDILRSHLKENNLYVNELEMMLTFERLGLRAFDSLSDYQSTINTKLSEINQDIYTGMSNVRETLSAKLVFDPTYTSDNFGEASKGIVDSIVNNLDPDMIAESGAKSIDELYNWFSSNVIQKIANGNYQATFNQISSLSDELVEAMYGGDGDAFKVAKSQFDELVKDWIDIDTGDIQIDQSADVVTQYLQRMAKEIQEQSKNYEIKIQMQTEFESPTNINALVTKYTGEYVDIIRNAFSNLNLGDNAGMKDIYEYIRTSLAGEDDVLRSDELIDLYQEWIDAGHTESMDGWSEEQINAIRAIDAVMKLYGTDIDTVKSKLMELGYILPSVKDIGSFNISSESTQEKVNEFEENISSIKEAWQSLSDGSMSKSEFIELAIEFPELMDGVNLADDNWMVKAKENLEELNQIKIDDFISMLTDAKAAMEARGEDTSVVDSFIGYANQLKSQPLLSVVADPNTLSALTTAYENFNEIQTQTNEIIADNIEVTQEYKDSLIELGISAEDLEDCFGGANGLVVKNSKLLNNLIKSTKNNIAQNAKLAKSQARLKYYELYKELKSLTNGRKVENAATLAQVDAIYHEMSALQKVISQYTILEYKLLGATNAYEKLAEAQAIDEATDYGSKAEELVNVLAEAFNTSQLGTEATGVAIDGLIPDDVIDKAKTLDEQMQQIYGYFTTGTISKLFTIEFDDDGGISSVEMTKENIEAFTESLIGNAEEGAVFQGTWDEFTLNPAIKNLDDFANAIGTTREVAFAYLTELEKYDISNILGGGDTLLDQLMGDNLEYQLQKAIQTAAEVEKKLAEGTLSASDQEYLDAQNQLEKQEEKALTDTTVWARKQQALQEQKDTLKELQKQYKATYEAGEDTSAIEDSIKNTSAVIDNLVSDLREIDEPTEFVLEVAKSEAEENIAEFKKKLVELVDAGDEKAIKINAFVEKIDTTGLDNLESLGFIKGSDGVWKGSANIEGWSSLDPTSKQVVLDYINQIEGEHNIDVLMGQGVVSVEEQLQTIANILADIAKILDPTYTLTVNTTDAEAKTSSFKSMWDSLGDKTVTLYQNVVETVKTFFTRTPKEGDDADNANGTAHANGTAYKSGSWGASKTETALVGELGPELLVRGSHWTTIGEHGAEFTQVKKGDIIFNHKQTEDLLSKGYVTGRGKIKGGSAFASGTAYAGINTWDDSYGQVHKDYQNAAGDLSGAADDLSDAADEFNDVVDWVEIRLEEINEQLDLLNSQMENAVGYLAKNQIIDSTIDLNKTKLTNLQAGMAEYENYAAQLLAKVPAQYRDAVQNGMIAINEFTGEANEETVEAINNYREWAQKVADLKQQIEDLESEIVELAKTKFDNVADEYDNIVSLIENANEKLDAQVSLMEDRGYVASKQYYESMMINTQQMQGELKKEKEVLQSVLDEQVRLGNIKVGSDAWYEMIDQLYEVDAAIVECTSDLENYQNAINDIYWDNFDELINRIDYLKDETQSLIDLMDSDDLVITPETEDGWSADDVKWTDEGIASLGLYAQQMEIAEYKSKQYAKAIDDLNSDYAAGKYSESEYLEKLNELTSAQYDSIEAYYDAQDAIKDLNKARVDEIKNGIEKQIDAYEKLINKKKELLDAEKDAVDFQRSIEESNKEISDIERQIASLSSDDSASARAKRAKLQAELAQAQQDLQDKFYDRSVEDQKEALDKELENFKEEKDKEVEKWEEYLEDVKNVLTDSLSLVKDSASEIYDTLHSKADEYNLTLSDSIISPWQNGSLAISDYQSVFDTAMSSTMDQLSSLKAEWQTIIDLMAKAAGKEITSQNKENNSYTAATSNKVNTSTSSASSATATVAKPTIKVGGKINAGNARIYSSTDATSGYKQYYSDDPIYKVLAIDGDWIQVRHHKLTTGVTGWFKKGHVNAYAKGTKGVKESQLALIDELGDELVMHADGNGKLAFLSKGSAVIPHDISENLMQLGELNPQDVLDRNRPVVNAPHITNNNIELNVSFGEVVHIDHVDNNAVPNLAKTVEKQIEKYMKGLNAEIRKFTR